MIGSIQFHDACSDWLLLNVSIIPVHVLLGSVVGNLVTNIMRHFPVIACAHFSVSPFIVVNPESVADPWHKPKIAVLSLAAPLKKNQFDVLYT
jgi:hypothetical protein